MESPPIVLSEKRGHAFKLYSTFIGTTLTTERLPMFVLRIRRQPQRKKRRPLSIMRRKQEILA
jgi:hypothetical protein